MTNKMEEDFQYDKDWPEEDLQRARIPYTESCDMKIIKYLIRTKDVQRLGGNKVWQEMSTSRAYNDKGRTWQQLRARFHKHIKKHINVYNLKNDEQELLLHLPAGYLTRRQNGATSVELSEMIRNKLPRSRLDGDEDQADNVSIHGDSRGVREQNNNSNSDAIKPQKATEFASFAFNHPSEKLISPEKALGGFGDSTEPSAGDLAKKLAQSLKERKKLIRKCLRK